MSNFNFNKVILGGRITADPELRTTPSGLSVTTFTVAVNRRFSGKNGEEQQADFFSVTAWKNTAEFITRFFRKASSICIVGTLQTRTWTDNQGQKRFATTVTADEAYFVNAKGAGGSSPPPPEAYQADAAPQFGEIASEEELPF